MNKNTKRPRKEAPCFCQETGAVLKEFVQKLGPPEAARRHFESARVEFLKGLRALLDARIERCSKRAAKGEKITVE